MSIGTMTSKGQITIPKDVREDLGLRSGSRVTFTRNDAGDYVLTTDAVRAGQLIGLLDYGGPPRTLEDMDRAIADGATAGRE